MITRCHELAPGVRVLYGGRFFGQHPHVNAVELTGSECAIVDPGLCHEEYLEPRRSRYDLVINTHCHPDHTSLNHAFSCPVACHPLERPYVEDPAALRDAMHLPSGELRASWDRLVRRLYRSQPCKVDRAIDEGQVLDLGGLRFRVLHIPGHSVGHVALFEETLGIAIAGDYDVNPLSANYTSPLCDLGDWYRSVDRLIELDPRILVTGHMQVVESDAAQKLAAHKLRTRRREENLCIFLKQPKTIDEIHEFGLANFGKISRRRPVVLWFFKVSMTFHVEQLVRSGAVRMLGNQFVAA